MEIPDFRVLEEVLGALHLDSRKAARTTAHQAGADHPSTYRWDLFSQGPVVTSAAGRIEPWEAGGTQASIGCCHNAFHVHAPYQDLNRLNRSLWWVLGMFGHTLVSSPPYSLPFFDVQCPGTALPGSPVLDFHTCGSDCPPLPSGTISWSWWLLPFFIHWFWTDNYLSAYVAK